MAIRLSTALRNFCLDSGFATAFDTTGVLEIRNGTIPADADTAVTGTILASLTLPADAFGAASSGAVAKAGTWSDSSADATGTATWFRLKLSADPDTSVTTQRRLDGTVGLGSGDLSLDNTSIATGQVVTITAFTVTQPAT